MSAAPKVTARRFVPIDEVKRLAYAERKAGSVLADALFDTHDKLDEMKAEWVMVEERDDGQALFQKANRFTRAEAAQILLMLDKQSNEVATQLSSAFQEFLATQDDVFFLVNRGYDGGVMMYSANRDGAYAFKAEVS